MESNPISPIPTATYRLQFHAGFTFAQATAILGYLRELGISHVYSSPYFQASESSTHGYDVADHNRLSPSLGGPLEYGRYLAGLRANELRQVLDFVPNHMGISEPINRWWMDVLENGPISQRAAFFDIEWHPLKQELENKVLLPILGDRYGRVLEKGEFELRFDRGVFTVHYFATTLPVNPRSYPFILERVAGRLDDSIEADHQSELLSISFAFRGLPDRSRTDAAAVALRAREKEVTKRRLARLAAESPQIADAIGATLVELNGRAGDSASFDAFDELLRSQVYRLSYWRVAAEEINYRRFFDINSLAAIRPEIPEVFEETHRLLLSMIERGEVHGVRIDHIDGLWNPREYLEQLRARASTPERPLYLIVEKILGAEEVLPADWPVQGTTGYEFGADATGVLVNATTEKMLTQVYERFTGRSRLSDMVYDKKVLVTRLSLASEIAVLGHLLDQLSEKNRSYRDFTLTQLTDAVRQTAACFPLYRTYITPDRPVRDEDRNTVRIAIARARRRNPHIDRPIFEFLSSVLLLEKTEGQTEGERAAQVRFALKFQQCTGPLMAKGLEDTTFYVYNRLIALNEVGGEPGRFGLSVEDFHARCAERRSRTPGTLLATSTHDSKRSEDARARIAAISEFADEWKNLLPRWSAATAEFKTEREGESAPSANEEYLLYQTLLGAWPLTPPEPAGRLEFSQRIQAFFLKALKEGKENSSWVEPDESWEKAARAFVDAVLSPDRGRRFLRLFEPFAERVAEIGALNSLAQLILKCTSPGVPDVYQGCETWDFSLVDPDNRRPVDYGHRQNLLASIHDAKMEELLPDWRSGRIKLCVLQRLLRLRRAAPALFELGDYQSLPVEGIHAGRVIAFSRTLARQKVVTLVPRLTAALGPWPRGETWGDTAVGIAGAPWQNVLEERPVSWTGSNVPVAELFQKAPFAVLSAF